MEIENTKRTLRINQTRYLMVITFIVLQVVLFTTDLVREDFLGLNKYYCAIVITVIYLGQNIFEYLRDFNYIYFNDENNNKILFRYISLRPFHNKRYSIEIGKDQFHSYRIDRSSVFKQQIIFIIKTPQGIAKYPPISISALNEDDFNKLKKALNKHVQ